MSIHIAGSIEFPKHAGTNDAVVDVMCGDPMKPWQTITFPFTTSVALATCENCIREYWQRELREGVR